MLALIDPLPPFLGSLLSLALLPSPSGVALLDTLHALVAGFDKSFRSSVVRSRVQLEFLTILGLYGHTVALQSSSRMSGWCHREKLM